MKIQFYANILWRRRHSDFVHISTLSSFGYSNREKDFISGTCLVEDNKSPLCRTQFSTVCHSVVYSPADSTYYVCFDICVSTSFTSLSSFFKVLCVPLPQRVSSCIASVFFNCTAFAVLTLYLDAMIFSVSCVLFAFILVCCQRGSLVNHAVLNPWVRACFFVL